MKMEICLKGGRGIGGRTKGPALVAHGSFSFFSDVDVSTGMVVERSHELFGKNVAGKVLVFFTAKGGVGSAWRIVEMKQNGCAPRALIVSSANPILVHGCIFSGVPLMEGFEEDPTTRIESGDEVEVDPNRGEVLISKARNPSPGKPFMEAAPRPTKTP